MDDWPERAGARATKHPGNPDGILLLAPFPWRPLFFRPVVAAPVVLPRLFLGPVALAPVPFFRPFLWPWVI